MSPLYLKDGKLLISDGKLATSENCCCEGECGCFRGSLPDTVTILFGTIPNTIEVPLVSLSVISCAAGGSGARAVATGTVGDPNEEGYPEVFLGPLAGSEITAGGSGYATLARVEPVLTVTGTGEGGIFTVTLTPTNDGCGLPAWRIASVKATGNLEGYVPDEQLTISIGEDDTEVTPAVLYYSEARSQPTVTATASTGEEAVFVVTLSRRDFPYVPATWRVASVSVSSGTGYVNDQSVTFSIAEGDTETTAAVAKLLTRLEPPVGGFTINTSTGSGATLSAPQWTLIESGEFDRHYTVSIDELLDFTAYLTDGGTGYEVGDFVTLTLTEGTAVVEFSAQVVTVGDNGEILEIFHDEPGVYYLETGIPESVVVTTAGVYYRDEDSNVFVESPGLYYGEDEELPRIAYPTTVVITQSPPSAGAGAEYEAVVDLDPESPTYGQITSLDLVDGGDGYLATRMEPPFDCANSLANQTLVLEKTSDCLYELQCFAAGLSPFIVFRISTNENEPRLTLTASGSVYPRDGGNPISATLTYSSDETIPDCSEFTIELLTSTGESIQISSGGNMEHNPQDDPIRLRACPFPVTIETLGRSLTISGLNEFGVGLGYNSDENGGIGAWCGTNLVDGDGNPIPGTDSGILGWRLSGEAFTISNILGSPAFPEQIFFTVGGECPCRYEASVLYVEYGAPYNPNTQNWTVVRSGTWVGRLLEYPPYGTPPGSLSDFEWELLDGSFGDVPADPLGLISVTIAGGGA